MTTWNTTTIAGGDYSALPQLPGVLVGQEYGFSDVERPAPKGCRWVPIQRDDEANEYEGDEAAAQAYARHVGSPVPPVWGVSENAEQSPDDLTGCDVFVAVPIGVTVDARGMVELPPASPLATVCGSCGRGWLDEHMSDATPAPSGRCPFEYEHDQTDDEDEEAQHDDMRARMDADEEAPRQSRAAFLALTELTRPGGILDMAIATLEDGGYDDTAEILADAFAAVQDKRNDMASDMPSLLSQVR